MKKNRLLHLMGEIEDQYVEEAYAEAADGAYEEKIEIEPKKFARPVWVKWCAIAASLIFVVGLSVAAVQSGWFLGKEHVVTLQNGERITFSKVDWIGCAEKINATARELTEEEAARLFPNLSVTGDVLFYTKDGSVMGVHGKIGEMDLFVVKKGIMTDDSIVEGEEEISTVNGIDVTAGYFLMRPNRKGERTILYYANFEIGNITFGLEYAGSEEEAKALRTELGNVIEKLIENGAPDFSNMKE